MTKENKNLMETKISNDNKSLKEKIMNKSNNPTAISKVEIQVRKTIETLKNKQDKWKENQKIADSMLYVLIEECVSFYRYLNKDERNLDAFKNVSLVKFRHRTKVYNVLAELIFGKGKQTYAYGKAIHLAYVNGIGENNQISVLQWLEENGGVNGVIRVSGSDTEAQNEHYKQIAVNYTHYLPSMKLPKIKGNELTNNCVGELIILIGKVSDINEIQILTSGVKSKTLIDKAYTEQGKVIAETKEYKENAYEAEQKIAERKKQKEEEMVEKLENIEKRVDERLLEDA